MLTADEIKSYLLHEDQPVRNVAVEYLADSWSQDATIVPRILKACDRYGDKENLHGLVYCHRFPLTEQAFEDVLERLANATDAHAIFHLNRAIAHAPVEFLIRHETAALDNPNLFEDTVEQVQRRRDVASWSGTKLWEELQDFARRSEDEQYVGEIDHDYADALVEALAAHDVPDAETICELLRSFDEQGGWLETFLIDLAGERRLQEAIPILVDKFRIDTDYMLEQCSESLAKIGAPEAVHLIREAFLQESLCYKTYTSGLLAKIKAQESEDALIALLESERDTGIRTDLCFGLCKLFSRRGVEIVRQEIHSGYDDMMVNLGEELLPVLHVLGIELPESDEWRREREERERFQAERRRELEELDRKYAALKERGVDPFADLGPSTKPEAPESQTYRHFEAKVGRNEPCPCGSGKKYKKCCGRK